MSRCDLDAALSRHPFDPPGWRHGWDDIDERAAREDRQRRKIKPLRDDDEDCGYGRDDKEEE